MNETNVVGFLQKISIVPLTTDIENNFKALNPQDLIMPEIAEEWYSSTKDIKIMEVDNYLTQLNLLPEIKKNIMVLEVSSGNRNFLFFKELSRLEKLDLIRHAELSGEGNIISDFSLKFTDFKKRYLKDQTSTFFELESDQLIINSIRLTADTSSQNYSRLKLTGAAAERAALRKKQQSKIKESNESNL